MTGSKAEGAPRASLKILSARQLGGHVFDPAQPERRFAVELRIDGQPAALARAEIYEAELAVSGDNDGCYAFLFNLPPGALAGARRLELWLANGAAPLDALDAPFAEEAETPGPAGEVHWYGGLRLHGWLGGGARQIGDAHKVRAFVDGRLVAEALADSWTHIEESGEGRARRAFDLFLPECLADGLAHRAEVVDGQGQALPGSPVFFTAFADGLRQFIQNRAELESERLRAAFFDRLIPQALPFGEIAAWRRLVPASPAADDEAKPVGVVLIGGGDVDASVESLEAQQSCDWLAAAFDQSAGGFDPAGLKQFLDEDAAGCETLVFTLAGARFQPGALRALTAALEAFPAAPWAYADFTVTAEDGGEWPLALSAFDYERLLEQGAGALLFAARRSYVAQALAAGADSLFRLCNFAFDRRAARGARQASPLAASPVHVPGFLARLPRIDARALTPELLRAAQAHFDARRAPARLDPLAGGALPLIRVNRSLQRTRLSILIPTRDRVDLLKPCIDSLFATVDLAAHECIVLDNESSEPETHAYFEQILARGLRVFKVGGGFNFSRIINAGAAVASGNALLLLNNDVEALHPGWLEEMQGRLGEPDVGAVGAKLLWPSGVVQHGGVVLGARYGAAHAFNDRIDGDPGYGDLLLAAHECSAVTAACLLTDKSLFHAAGGFDAMNFPVNFNDVDYCLKLRAKGLRIVQTPHARLLHRESASRGKLQAEDKSKRLNRELTNLRAAWGEALVADPSYSPLLSLDPVPYSALAWPPRPAAPRQPGFPQKRAVPPGF